MIPSLAILLLSAGSHDSVAVVYLCHSNRTAKHRTFANMAFLLLSAGSHDSVAVVRHSHSNRTAQVRAIALLAKAWSPLVLGDRKVVCEALSIESGVSRAKILHVVHPGPRVCVLSSDLHVKF